MDHCERFVCSHPPRPSVGWLTKLCRYRTPLCVLYSSRVIAVACYILAQQYIEGPSSLSLAARISSPAPLASLPTPPSHKLSSPESARFALEFFKFNEMELASLSGAACMCTCISDLLGLTSLLRSPDNPPGVLCGARSQRQRRASCHTRGSEYFWYFL